MITPFCCAHAEHIASNFELLAAVGGGRNPIEALYLRHEHPDRDGSFIVRWTDPRTWHVIEQFRKVRILSDLAALEVQDGTAYVVSRRGYLVGPDCPVTYECNGSHVICPVRIYPDHARSAVFTPDGGILVDRGHPLVARVNTLYRRWRRLLPAARTAQ